MKKYLFSILFLQLLLTSSIAAQKPSRKADQAQEASGLLYKISGNDIKKPSYLFGTIHLLCPQDMFSQTELAKYFDKTEQLFLEIDMDDDTEMAALAKGLYLQNGVAFDDLLTPEKAQKVDDLTRTYLGIPLAFARTIKPVILQTMLLTSPKILGCAPPASYEITLMEMASARKRSVEGLETVQTQFEVLDKTPLEKQSADLYEMALDPEKSITEFRALLATYKKQNSDHLFSLIDAQMGKDKALRIGLLDDRNKSWIPKIEKAIKDRPSFIAIGAGHLGGDNGVVNLLRAKGYKIEAIRL